MIDAALKNSDNGFDLDFSSTDITAENGLQSMVLLSLFSDAKVSDEELPNTEIYKRGFWGDMFENNVTSGSKLWLLGREKTLPETRERLKEYAKESLSWMEKDGIVSSIRVNAEIMSSSQIELYIYLSRPGNSESKFDFLWSSEGIKYGL